MWTDVCMNLWVCTCEWMYVYIYTPNACVVFMYFVCLLVNICPCPKKKKTCMYCHILHGFLILFLFFGKSEGTRNIIALGTIPLATIEKFTKTVSSLFCSFLVCISLFCTLSRKLDLVFFLMNPAWSINISIISLCSYFSETRI